MKRDLTGQRTKMSQVFVVILGALVVLPALGAWFQHLYTCFTEESWGFLIAGAIFFPVAIVHGVGIWFGIW